MDLGQLLKDYLDLAEDPYNNTIRAIASQIFILVQKMLKM